MLEASVEQETRRKLHMNLKNTNLVVESVY